MKILHLADVHLDRPFVGLPLAAARRRRAELSAAFRRCLVLANEHDVDLVTIGGDLWEDEHVTADTRNSVVYELEKVGRQVLVICGNHDPFLPGGAHARTRWPDNVGVVRTSEPELHQFDDVAVWGVSWTGGQLSASFLSTLRAPDDGRTHLLLLHGTAGPLAYLTEGDTFTFQAQQVREAGFAYCLAGHVHVGSDDGTIVYPGSPEPLRWNETGPHCIALVTVTGSDVATELLPVNEFRVEERQVPCDGSLSSAEVADRVREELLNDAEASGAYLRLALTGEVGADCTIELRELRGEHEGRYAGLLIEDRTEPALDIASRVEKRGLDGRFVRQLQAMVGSTDHEADERILELALEAGLRAIDNREPILHVD